MLTESKIRALKPRARRYTVTDARGLGLEVMPSGLKVWRLRLSAKRSCLPAPANETLGLWPQIKLNQARKTQYLILKLYEDGFDGLRQWRVEQVKERFATVREFGARYIKEVIEVDRKDPKQLTRILEKVVFARIGERVMSQVTGAEVRELIFKKRDAGKPSAAAALRNLMKRMWTMPLCAGRRR